jgi:2,5-dioxopentanoate dehydrogenase
MRAWLLVALAFVAGFSGMVVAANMHGVLAYISYHLVLPPPPSFSVVSAYVNLGNLTPGAKGVVTATAKLIVGSPGYFRIKLFDHDFDHVFSNFTVVVGIGNRTVVLGFGRGESAVVYLTPGNYTVTITVYYVVSESPHGPPNVVDKPLITISPVGEHEGVGGNYTSYNETEGSD